jgi:hypothetical protein
MYPIPPPAKVHLVAEEMASYARSLPRYSKQQAFTQGLLLTAFFADRMLLVELIRKGIPTSL